jgi:hypothetical protein
MKPDILVRIFFALSISIVLTACTETDNLEPEADIYASPWYTPTSWEGEAYDWYFGVTNAAISEEVVEEGIILAYMSIPDDLYEGAVRPLPAWAVGANWEYIIPGYGEIEFLCDKETVPGTTEHYFRFVLIPPGKIISTKKSTALTREQLMQMPYKEVCDLLGIEE